MVSEKLRTKYVRIFPSGPRGFLMQVRNTCSASGSGHVAKAS